MALIPWARAIELWRVKFAIIVRKWWVHVWQNRDLNRADHSFFCLWHERLLDYRNECWERSRIHYRRPADHSNGFLCTRNTLKGWVASNQPWHIRFPPLYLGDLGKKLSVVEGLMCTSHVLWLLDFRPAEFEGYRLWTYVHWLLLGVWPRIAFGQLLY